MLALHVRTSSSLRGLAANPQGHGTRQHLPAMRSSPPAVLLALHAVPARSSSGPSKRNHCPIAMGFPFRGLSANASPPAFAQWDLLDSNQDASRRLPIYSRVRYPVPSRSRWLSIRRRRRSLGACQKKRPKFLTRPAVISDVRTPLDTRPAVGRAVAVSRHSTAGVSFGRSGPDQNAP